MWNESVVHTQYDLKVWPKRTGRVLSFGHRHSNVNNYHWKGIEYTCQFQFTYSQHVRPNSLCSMLYMGKRLIKHPVVHTTNTYLVADVMLSYTFFRIYEFKKKKKDFMKILCFWMIANKCGASKMHRKENKRNESSITTNKTIVHIISP